MRFLPFAIGAAGLVLMVFVMLVMYIRSEDVYTAPVPVEESAAPDQDTLLPAPPPAKPAKPEKPPPLNER
jgi:hypothetical protein